jgi:hypothetical protein
MYIGQDDLMACQPSFQIKTLTEARMMVMMKAQMKQTVREALTGHRIHPSRSEGSGDTPPQDGPEAANVRFHPRAVEACAGSDVFSYGLFSRCHSVLVDMMNFMRNHLSMRQSFFFM